MMCMESGVLRHGNVEVLKQVSVTMHSGEVTCVLGMNGAGKSSLLSVMCGERKLEAGRVLMDDVPLSGFSRQALAQRRAVLPQHSTLAFPMSVEEIVGMGRAPYHMSGEHDVREGEFLHQVLAHVGLIGFEARSYDALSGGERQRVQLARVLMQLAPLDESLQGKWLFLDEPTASQDMSRAHDILRLSRMLSRQGLGVCVVVHDLNLALRYADKVIVLEQGRVLCEGAPLDVLTTQTLARGFELDARVDTLSCGTHMIVVGADPHLLNSNSTYQPLHLP